MRRLLLLLIPLVALGCGDQQAAPTQEPPVISATRAAQPPKQQPLSDPTFGPEARLGLARISGRLTKVGMTLDDALSNFGQPPGTYEKSELPPSLGEPGRPYEAWGWQTKGEGFGAILFKGRVAAAIYQHERLIATQLDELLRLHEDTFGQPAKTAIGKYVRYWFWFSGGTVDKPEQILMICGTEVGGRKFNVTAAIGIQPVMDALGMTADAASRDQVKADSLIEKQRSGGRANSANSTNRAGT